MSDFFSQPDPQQAVPGDLAGLREALIRAILGNPVSSPGMENATGAPQTERFNVGNMVFNRPVGPGRDSRAGREGGALEALLGLIGDGGSEEMIERLRASSDQRLNDQLGEFSASAPGRFSSAYAHEEGRIRERSQNDFNLLSSQVQEQARNRQLQAIMALLGPALGPTFGGPFTQGASGFDHLLGGIGAAGNLLPFLSQSNSNIGSSYGFNPTPSTPFTNPQTGGGWTDDNPWLTR